MLWIVIIILLYILYEWERYIQIIAITCLVNKRAFRDSTLILRFILVVVIAILVRYAITA